MATKILFKNKTNLIGNKISFENICFFFKICLPPNRQILISTITIPRQFIDFPQNEQKRRFQEKWYNLYSWLEYEVTTDSSFCYICKQYPIKDKEKPTFKTSGFKDWKNAKKFFEIHETSESHKTNQMLHYNRVSVEKSRKSCANKSFKFFNFCLTNIFNRATPLNAGFVFVLRWNNDNAF